MLRRNFLAIWLTAPGRGTVLQAMQQVMGPLRLPAGTPRLDSAAEHDDGVVRSRKIRCEAEPGDWVPAWLQMPVRASRPLPGVLCLHQTTRPGKDEPAGFAGQPNLHYARELAARGFVTLSPDYPNFGEYTFDPYARGYASATMKGIVNHMGAAALLRSLPAVDRRRIAACGHSLGGHNALFLAAFDPRIRAVVTSCGFTSFAKYMGGDLKGWSHRGYMPRIESVYGCDPARMPFDFSDVLACIAPRPVFINAPLGDSNFDHSGVDDSVAAVRALYRRSGDLRVEHPDSAHDFPPAVRLQAWDWLERILNR